MADVNREIVAARIEVLASEGEIVVPRDLPQFGGLDIAPLPIKPDWIDKVEVETSWRTDVTRSSAENDEERRQLLTRPLRTVTTTFKGMNNTETHLIAQAVMGYAYKNGPAPIACDQIEITSSEDLGDGTAAIYGDTTFRRLAVGQRIALVANIDPVKESDDYLQWALIREVHNDRLILESVPSTLPADGWLAYPCIDAEVVGKASGTFLVDNVLNVRVTWEETAGPETLPASHPPLNFDNLQGLVGYDEGGRPILDFPPDWSEGLSVEIERRGRNTPTGLSRVFAAEGEPFHRFRLSFLSDGREQMWNLLRFFDALQGRTGEFYYVNPSDPWTITTIPSTSQVNITAVGSHEEIFLHFTHVGMVRSDGTVLAKKLTSTIDDGSTFQLRFDGDPLPDTAFVGVRPIHLCRLDKDSLSESWITNTVSTSELLVLETRTFDEVTSPSDETEFLYETYRTKTKTLQSNPKIWIEANTNVFSTAVDDRLPRANEWPDADHRVYRIYDVREPLPAIVKDSEFDVTYPFIQESPTAANPGGSRVNNCALMRFTDQWQNNQAPAVFGARFFLSNMSDDRSPQPNEFLPIDQKHLWSPDNGFTLFLCFTPFAESKHPYTTGVEQPIFRIEDDASPSNPLFEVLGVYEGGGSFDATGMNVQADGGGITNINFNASFGNSSEASLVVITWNPANDRIYAFKQQNHNLISGAGFVGGISSIKRVDDYRSFVGDDVLGYEVGLGGPGSIGQMTQSGFTRGWGDWGCFNAILTWNRHLTDTEVNDVAGELDETYKFIWQDITYP